MTNDSIANLVEQAKQGDFAALENVILSIQDSIYRLAIRMLAHPEDAQDATQEILVKIVTGLNGFRGESSFTTWVYRVAANYLFSLQKRRSQLQEVSFERKAEMIERGLTLGETLAAPDFTQPDRELLTEEIKIGCTQGMLMCLDREHRLAYILGEIFEVSSDEGAEILEITSAAFRQRLSRARKDLRAFMKEICGLVKQSNVCRCSKQIAPAIYAGKLKPDEMLYARHPINKVPIIRSDFKEERRELGELDRAAAIFRSHPDYAAPNNFVRAVREILASNLITCE